MVGAYIALFKAICVPWLRRRPAAMGVYEWPLFFSMDTFVVQVQ